MQVDLTSATGQTQNAGGGVSRGYDEQWQRALEKAYFERQTELLRSTGPAEMESSPGPGNSPDEVQRRVLGNDDSAESLVNISSQQSALSLSNEGTLSEPSFFLWSKKSFESPSHSHDSIPAHQPALSCRFGQDNKIFSSESNRDVVLLVKRVLPSANSVTVLTNDEGLHVIIRDASLNKNILRKFLYKVRSFLSGSNQRLKAVTLNGELVWECQGLLPLRQKL